MEKILLAEGNQDIRFTADEVLHTAGYEVKSLTSGTPVDVKIDLPDIFVPDQQLRVIDGFSISQFFRIKKESKRSPSLCFHHIRQNPERLGLQTSLKNLLQQTFFICN